MKIIIGSKLGILLPTGPSTSRYSLGPQAQHAQTSTSVFPPEVIPPAEAQSHCISNVHPPK